MKNKMKNDEGKFLFAVNYVERPSLKDCECIRTHSLERAIERARYLLKNRDDVLYSQVVVYRYSSILDYYQFVTLRNFYSDNGFNSCKKLKVDTDKRIDDLLFSLIMED